MHILKRTIRHGAIPAAACLAALLLAACSAPEEFPAGSTESTGFTQETGSQTQPSVTQESEAATAETNAPSGSSQAVETQQTTKRTPKQTAAQESTQKSTQKPAQTTTTTKKPAAPNQTASTKKPASTTRRPAATQAPVSSSDYTQEVLRLVNAERQKAGKQPLTMDAKLSQAAQVRAKEIQTHFSHSRPDGRSCFTAMQEAGVSYRAAGENIAAGQRTPAAVMEAWMNSQGHRENILSDQFGRLGVGYVVINGRAHWVQMFAD